MFNNGLKKSKSIPLNVSAMIDWTEKYRPHIMDDLILEPYRKKKSKKMMDPKQEILSWAEGWNKGKPKKKGLILSGKPGIGKTSCAYVLAHHYQWIPIELNTSDARNKTRIRKVATAGAQHQSFSDDGRFISTKHQGRKVIILDEADNLYERMSSGGVTGENLSDRGGKKEIVQTLKMTKQPMILLVNNYYDLIKGSGKELEKYCLHIPLFPPSSLRIYQKLSMIADKQGIQVDDSLLQKISETCHGDIRSAIRDLQSLSIGRTTVSLSDKESLGFRDEQQEIFDVLSTIFSGNDITKIKSDVRSLTIDPSLLLLWVNENIPRGYTHVSEMAKAFHHVSSADIYLSRTYRRNNYRMWAYASDHMTIGVSLSKSYPPGYIRFQYPLWLRKQKKSPEKRQQLELIASIAHSHHCSLNKAKQKIYPYLIRVQRNMELSEKETKKVMESEENKKTISPSKKDQKKGIQIGTNEQKTLFL